MMTFVKNITTNVHTRDTIKFTLECAHEPLKRVPLSVPIFFDMRDIEVIDY